MKLVVCWTYRATFYWIIVRHSKYIC